MGLTKRQAEERAAALLRANRERGSDWAIIASRTTKASFGWICWYDSVTFLKTNESRCAIAGAGPIVVNGRDGTAELAGSGVPIADLIQMYERKWGSAGRDSPLS